MKVRFYLERKVAKNKEAAIWCYVRELKETIYLNTGQKIKRDLWDTEKQRGNLRNTRDTIIKKSLNDLNQYLNAYESKIFEIEQTVRRKDFSASFGKVSDEIKKQFQKVKLDFFGIYDKFIQESENKLSKNQVYKHKRTKELLSDYQTKNRERLDFEKITPAFYDRFKNYMLSNTKFIDNTINKHLTLFKTFLIWANKNEYTSNLSYKTLKVRYEDNEVIYLTEDQLMKLYNLELSDERLQRVRDIFVFQCFVGTRYSDIENLSREDIRGTNWNLRTQKTHQIIEIPLNGYALSNLARYSDYPQPLPAISNQKMNEYLKELCEIAKLDEHIKIVKYKGGKRIEETFKKYELITTHCARRTFVSLSLQKGMKPAIIMAITGHRTFRMMQRYLEIADKLKREEMDKVWGSPLRIVS